MSGSPSDVTVAIGVSRGFWTHCVLAIGTIPRSVPVLLSWFGEGDPGELPPNVRVVRPLRTSDNYMRGYVLNVAVRSVETPYVLLADADMLYPEFFFNCLPTDFDAVLRFYVGRLTPEASQAVEEGTDWERLFSDYQGIRSRVFSAIYGAHNPCVYPTRLFHRLRGYDERMVGWGAEDDDLTIRTRRTGASERRLPIIVADLHHGDSPDYPTTYRRGETSTENLRILDEPRPAAANYDGWGDGD